LSIGNSELSKAGVGHLINMKKLHSLDLGKKNIRDLDFIATVAGEVPNLQNLDLTMFASNQNQFIEELAERYPQKELLVNRLS
jgi:hypothetical protein